LRFLSAKDFRSCISSWASEHKSEQVRLHAAALQNHSVAVHEAKYRKNKVKQAMGQSVALMKDLNKAAGQGENTESSEEEVRIIFGPHFKADLHLIGLSLGHAKYKQINKLIHR
jgi:hypothetical protein